jgi:predicted NACHT family NTPase
VLLDGLDEVTSDSMRRRVNESINDVIEEFLTKWCPAIERHQAMAIQGMKPLTPRQESQLQTIGLEQKDDLLNIFDGRPSIKRLAVNPLMLTMLALVQRSKGNLPQRPSTKFDKVGHSWYT